MSDNPLVNARHKAEAASTEAQGRNRQWWEAVPMTYQDWEEGDRDLATSDAFAQVEADFLFHNPWLRENFDFANFRNSRVLEIGCGAGAASCLFAKGSALVSAIDLTDAAVEMTRRNAASRGLDVDVRQMDAEKLAFPDDSFDYVFSWGVIHHSHSTENAIDGIRRVLRPGGRGLIMVYNRSSLRYWLKGMIWLFAKGKLLKGDGFDSVQRYFTDGYYHRHFSPSEFRRVLSSAGLTVERMSVSHMAKRMIPLIPKRIDDFLKRHWGWLLIAEFALEPAAASRK